MKKQTLLRWIAYIAGLVILALGLTLNTKADLGVSAIISVSYSLSVITGVAFGNMTLALYCCFVAAQILLHLIDRRGRGALILDALQIPLSLVFTRVLNLFSDVIPSMSGSPIAVRLLGVAAAIALTGVGAAMSLNMRIVPNPGDGIVQALADHTCKSVGLCKNAFDVFNILLTVILSLTLTGHLEGVGIGTVMAVAGVGRVIALFNRLTRDRLLAATGLNA